MKTISLNVDAHFVIGGLHIRQNKPCQDHANSGVTEDAAFIVVSDGCSTGGHTDIGARIITSASGVALKEQITNNHHNFQPDSIKERIKELSFNAQALLGLDKKDLQATCLYALVNAQGGLIHVLGDGMVILKYRDENIVFRSFNWQGNMPYYPSYIGVDMEQFITTHRNIEEANKSLVIRESFVLPDTEPTTTEHLVPLEEAIKGYVLHFDRAMLEELDSIILCSDGVESFRSDEGAIETLKVVKEISSFKTSTGDFVKRRLTRLLDTFAKEGIKAFDDVACAAIHFNHNSNNKTENKS